jgi:hypothetical protein
VEISVGLEGRKMTENERANLADVLISLLEANIAIWQPNVHKRTEASKNVSKAMNKFVLDLPYGDKEQKKPA